ncbi:MAG: hypothetical protein AAGA44_03635 [Pseudomonadota bacterium]
MNALERFLQFQHKTFGDAAALYLAEFDGKCKSRQVHALDKVLPYVAEVKLIEFEDSALDAYRESRLQSAMAGTVNKEISTVVTILNKAAKHWRWIPYPPHISTVTGPCKRAYPLSWEEQAKLLYRLTPRLRRICEFVLNTGVTRAELFSLRWEDGREKDGVEYYVLKSSYHGRHRPVVLNTVSREILDQLDSEQSEFLFPQISLNKTLRDAWIKAGLPNNHLVKKGLDNLRVTYGVRLKGAGATDDEYDYLMGRQYRKLSKSNSVIDLRRLEELAEGITKVSEPDLGIFV